MFYDTKHSVLTKHTKGVPASRDLRGHTTPDILYSTLRPILDNFSFVFSFPAPFVWLFFFFFFLFASVSQIRSHTQHVTISFKVLPCCCCVPFCAAFRAWPPGRPPQDRRVVQWAPRAVPSRLPTARPITLIPLLLLLPPTLFNYTFHTTRVSKYK